MPSWFLIGPKQIKMNVEQLYTSCLAEAAYYIESNGEAAIIDPLREVDQYIEMAESRGAKIKYVFETHFHADFVSGHIDLAKKTGATIVYGPTAKPDFEAHIAEDDELLSLGKSTIKVLHTPGHTMESSSFLLMDEAGKPTSIFTGDTLFIGDVGRPDLAVKTDLTREDLAGHLFDSLRNKIIPLSDDLIVYPGHGQGSACGKNMSSETTDTLGNQKKTNYALDQNLDRDAFIEVVIDGLIPPPQYFPKNAVMNKQGYKSFDEVLKTGLTGLSVTEFEAEMNREGIIILDTRNEDQFTEAHIPTSIFIGIDGTFAPWVGVLIEDLDAPILIVADPGREEEVITRISRVGYDNTIGFLDGGFTEWQNAKMPTEQISNIDPKTFVSEYPSVSAAVLDVRKCSEYNSQHFTSAQNFPLDSILTSIEQLDPKASYYVHCAGGYRSVAAASIMKRAGVKDVVNILGGFDAIAELDTLETTQFQEAVTML
jgi:hydroxyacylglutathione hydrolase